jgi:hypothetical protein
MYFMQISSDIGSYNPFMPIDTLAIAKMLEAAGTPQKQAEAHARVWGEVVTHNLAGKADIAKIEERIEQSRLASKADITKIEERIEQSRLASKADITRIEDRIEQLRHDTVEKIEQSRHATIEKIEHLRKDTIIEVAQLRGEVLKWVIPLMLTHFAAVIGSVAWLLKTIGH